MSSSAVKSLQAEYHLGDNVALHFLGAAENRGGTTVEVGGHHRGSVLGPQLVLLEGPLDMSTENTSSNLGRVLEPVWKQVDDAVELVLKGVTLGSLGDRWTRTLGAMYHI